MKKVAKGSGVVRTRAPARVHHLFETNDNNKFQSIIKLIFCTDKNRSMQIKFPILSQTI